MLDRYCKSSASIRGGDSQEALLCKASCRYSESSGYATECPLQPDFDIWHWTRVLQAMYQLAQPGATDHKLWFFITLMGCITVLCAQFPTLHSQRLLNGITMLNTALFSLLAVILSIYQGWKYRTPKDYGMSKANPLLCDLQQYCWQQDYLSELFSADSVLWPAHAETYSCIGIILHNHDRACTLRLGRKADQKASLLQQFIRT